MADAPLEVGHELALATLLVYFDVDKLEQLAPPLRRVIQDVYDIASDLAATKVAYQRKAAVLEQELARLRAANEAATSNGSRPRSQRAVATRPRGCLKPRWDASTRIETGRRVELPRAVRQAPRLGEPSVQAYRRWASAPDRVQVARVTPLPQGERHASRPASARPISTGGDASNPTNSHAKNALEAHAATAPKDGRTLTTTPVPSEESSLLPSRQGDRKPPPDAAVQQCRAKQTECEREVHILQRKFGQVALWQPQYKDGELVVLVPSADGSKKDARVLSVQNIQSALGQVCDEVEDLRQACFEALQRVSNALDCQSWLQARHAQLESMLDDIDEWVGRIAMATNKFSSADHFSRFSTVQSSPAASTAVWNDVNHEEAHSVPTTGREGLLPTCWSPLTNLYVEYAISAFRLPALEVYVVNHIPGFDFHALTKIGEAARELENILEAFKQARRQCKIKHARSKDFTRAFKRRHKIALRCIQERAVACSQVICGVASSSQATPRDRAYIEQADVSCFGDNPSSPLWKTYEDLVLAIASCHVGLTRLHEVPVCDQVAAKQAIVARLFELEEAIKLWLDERLSSSSDDEALEHHMKLSMDWCGALQKVVDNHNAPAT